MRAGLAVAVMALTALGTHTSAPGAASGTSEPGKQTPGNQTYCAPDGAAPAAEARVRPGSQLGDIGDVTRAQQRAMERQLRSALAEVEPRGVGPITVPVRMHVILRDNGTGGVTNVQIAAQLEAINRAFAGATSGPAAASPFTFELASISRTRNSDWYAWTLGDDDAPAKRALHRGGPATLNVYVAGLRRGLLGYAYFPVPQPLFRDGLVLLNESLPGGSAAPYNRGDTATHEIGHWLGLYHTFENSCAKPGDRVADTPRQFDGRNVYKCNEALNTCPALGRDPVHNFMSYGTDLCLNMFTTGQVNRMVAVWKAFRAP